MVEEGPRPQSKRDESKCFLFIQLVLFKVISNWCDNWMNSKKNKFFFFFLQWTTNMSHNAWEEIKQNILQGRTKYFMKNTT